MAMHEELYNSGQISTKALTKIGRATRPQNSKMASFEKPGPADEGMHKDLGEIGTNHIREKRFQDTGSPRRASGLPSKGARAPMGGTFPHSNEIGEGERQKPEMPRGAGKLAKKATARPFHSSDVRTAQRRGDNNAKGKWSTPRKLKGPSNPKNTGNWEGGHNNRTTG
jgi:hypothetical protein